MRGNAQTGKFEPLAQAPLAPAEPPAPAPEAVPAPAEPEPAPEAPSLPEEPALPSISILKASPPEEAAPAVPEPPAPPQAPQTEFQKRAFKFTPPKAPATGAKRLPTLGAAKSFRVIKKEEPPAAAPGVPVYEWNVSSPPPAGLPEAKPAAPIPAADPMRLNPPTPVPPPPATMRMAAPGAPTADVAIPAFQAPPTPTLTPLTPETAAPPPSPFAGPALGAAGPAYTPSRSNSEPAATPLPAAAPADDVLKRLARPEPPKTVEKPKPRNSKVFLAASGVLVLVLIACFAFFLRRPGDLKNMVTLGDNHKKLGVEDDAANQIFKPKASAPAPAPAPAPAAQVPTPAPVAALPAVVDESAVAIELVKGFPLDGNRGTVGQWLTYSFTANPGSDNAEDWHAGAQAATIYTVEYSVKPGPRSALKQTIVYVFEADLERKIVRGMNPPAHELMRGPKPAAPVKKKARPAPKRRPTAKIAPPPPKEVPLIPLPSDTELLPPAEGDSQFKSDTVQ